jgi:hypothetical protein
MMIHQTLAGLAMSTALAVSVLAVPVLAVAQPMPMQGGGAMLQQDPNHVRGRVDSFDGHYRLVVHGQRVRLHPGTVIHPTGATIAPGQFVIVRGHWTGHHFDADEVRIRS